MYLSLFTRKYAFHITHSSVRKLNYFSETYNRNVDLLKSKIDNVKLPDRFKGTIVEKWTLYWKELYTDYYEVARETVTNARSNPTKSSIYLTCFGFLIYCNKTNPTESSYRDSLITASNNVLLVSTTIRNPASDQHLKFIEACYNEGLIRSFSFGIFSVMWIDDYDQAVALFKANCSYLQPQYLTIYQRIIDIGFLNNWWLINRKMVDYDINPTEWPAE